MAIYLEMPNLNKDFPFRTLVNDGNILTTPHWHREIELIYVTKGKISLGVDDVPYKLSQGEIAFISSGVIHYVLASPGSERQVYQFDLSYFTALNKENIDVMEIFSKLQPVSTDWSKQTEIEIQKLLESIDKEMSTSEPGYQFAVKAAIYRLITILIREIPKKERKAKKINPTNNEEVLERLDGIFRYVEKYYKEPISLQKIADISGYSTFYFTKFFKKNTGKTFLTFLNDYRIDKAKWLLINSDYPVSEIISETGFESDKTFYRLFKKTMKMPPLDYRNKMKL
ncbi:helix-turn-helix domain-containing protein [Enterococcus massiliensis]|uniref:helix-turn-helix domain-containing protein n=1 Tax=Enterococcus massiliensis TaxID=1640685 RepID=UPI00065E7F96|nr:AraC family transcriptional regulator [Enterococcus massiliensis]